MICQLKSTDAESIKFNKRDFDVLAYNAAITRKLPLFALQFLKTNEVFLLIRPEDLQAAAEYIETGEYQGAEQILEIDLKDSEELKTKGTSIKSSSSARERFKKENEKKFTKEKRKAT